MSPIVVRCLACRLNQYMPASTLCRRCRADLVAPVPLVVEVPKEVPMKRPKPTCTPETVSYAMAATIVEVRHARRMSQRQLAARLNCPRTYISKLERGHCIPMLSSLMRIANALELPMWQMVEMAEFRQKLDEWKRRMPEWERQEIA